MLRLKFGDWRLKVHLYSQNVHRLLIGQPKNVGLWRSCDIFVVRDEFWIEQFLPFWVVVVSDQELHFFVPMKANDDFIISWIDMSPQRANKTTILKHERRLSRQCFWTTARYYFFLQNLIWMICLSAFWRHAQAAWPLMLRLKFGDWRLKMHLHSRNDRLLANHSKNVGLQRSCDLFVVTDHFINSSVLRISLSSCQINTFFVRTLPNGARSRILTKFLSHWLICRRSAQTASAYTYYRGLVCEYRMVGTRYHIAC